mmetsp:Transcript_23290/g.37093  ORF Transcript_23290/g.37093 Transcript_23290/m.37093 type:complete len:275 (+) Transcript_23290:51-875(+)|eukprot:CAMPEP_0197057330 /NCGR_PEP_ID=MMETSP1384-20130603/95922_1 /TAXON_ID=29189 /ORGANISM="Ammonia sp." /LENGTH=274 /DNA_ID=CAMNT_0042491719 /DNA_START=35 /DNA_END=859 /DNA_ORIENTATION=+
MAAPKKASLNFSKETTIIKKDKKPTAAIIWMHGLGDTAMGWTNAIEAIISKMPYITGILPTAPMISITFQGGQAATAWHDIEDLQNLTNNTFKYKEDSLKLITALIDDCVDNQGIHPSRIILGGFSQGAAMAIYCGLQYKARLGGIVALSGYLCDMDVAKKVQNAETKQIPIIMYHGNNDMIVQTQFGRLSAMLLKSGGFEHTQWEEFEIPMQMNFGHNVVQAELNKVAKFVAQNLPKEYKLNKNKPPPQQEEKENEKNNNQKVNSNNKKDNGD